KPGTELATDPGERLRVLLPDESVLYVDQKTAVRLDADRSLSLTRGSVFVAVAHRDAPFVVKTPKRHVKATGTRFAVRSGDAGADVLVTRGKVEVEGVAESVQAGQQLAADATNPTAAPRATALLDWTRDLMADGEARLVPASKHGGGALVAVDANG